MLKRARALRVKRLRKHGADYIGEGKIRAKLNYHLTKAMNPKDQQGSIFSSAGTLECSWVSNNTWRRHQRLELENDLIAAHLLVTQTVPAAQFLG